MAVSPKKTWRNSCLAHHQRRLPKQRLQSAAPVAVVGDRSQKRVPMTRLRKTIANRLLEAKNSTAMLTTFNEVNMKPIMELRERVPGRV